MKRTPLRRSTKPIARHSRLKAKGGSRFPHRRCQPYLDWLKEQPCIVSGLRTGEFIPSMTGRNLFWRVEVQPAHIKTRGSGGDDLYNAVSLANHMHEEQHRRGIKTFQQLWFVDLKAKAREQTDRWLQTPEGQAWASRFLGPRP